MYKIPSYSQFEVLLEQIKPGQTQKIPGPTHPFLIAYLLHHLKPIGPYILVSTQNSLLSQIHEALRFFEPEQKVFSLKSELEEHGFSRQEEMRWLQLMAKAQIAIKTDIFMLDPKKLIQKTIPPYLLKKKSFLIKKSQLLPFNFSTFLINLGYQSHDRVEQMGEFSMRGAVLDIFCPLNGPIRTELIGNEISQIKTFDIKSQISIREIEEAQISPAAQWSVYEKKDYWEKVKKHINSKEGAFFIPFSFQDWNRFLLQGEMALYTEEIPKTFPFENHQKKSSKDKNTEEKIKNLYDFLKAWKAPFVHNSPFTFLDHFSLCPFIWNLDEPNFLNNYLLSWKAETTDLCKNKKFYPTFTDMYQTKKRVENVREVIFDSLSPSFVNSKNLTSSLSKNPAFSEKDKQLQEHLEKHSLSIFSSKNFFKKHGWPKYIKTQRRQGNLIFISVGREQTKKELQETLETSNLQIGKESLWFEKKESQQANPKIVHLVQGFSFENLIWSEENLFFLKADSFLSPIKKKASSPEENITALSFNFAELKPGDLVVHKQYGIGLFQQLNFLDFGTGKNEFLILKYKEDDLLYVPIHAFHLIQKYSGPFINNQQILDKLGDKKWLNTKEKVKKRIKNMAMELINLYSLRNSLKRKKFSRVGENFKKLETEFPFQETPDQKKAIEDILNDLTQKDTPTDRLICGDTGFGKTEVALRAGFKVIEEGFQVCLIAPTTILSFQHFERFKERLANWPISIYLLNRFTSTSERKHILKETKSGKVDILIGTHRILSRDTYFKKLGLLIIDEEHLFGVKSKEKIKNWHAYVDTISLSATPIPRSLSMSLSGLRDISLILTPPLNRKSIKTFISPFKEELIKKAVLKEQERKGQVIFIHNRISDIFNIENQLKNLLPSVRIRTAHGKMKNLQEKIVLDFFQEKFDLLLCTTIVESGMDFPKAGTLFINQAEQFGLSQLHQLRGRVGRSERQSYCYLLTDSYKKISQTALGRLKIIQENNQPGAGITIAQYDLEMRGAGELMGAEQSGFLQNVGYEMYFEFLRENIFHLNKEQMISAPEPDLQFNKPAFIPHNYIPHEKARLVFYKRLATALSEKEVEQIRIELKDFAGPLPLETTNLFLLNQLRLIAKNLHARELSYRSPWFYISFVESSPLSHLQIAKWVKDGFCHLHNQNTLKFFLKEENLEKILNILEKLIFSLKF